MPNSVLLNNVDHQQLRVITAHGAAYGDDVMLAPTFAAEFRDLQASYPIVFRQSADAAGFEPVALLGFQQGENLFLDGSTWDAPYVPLMIRRQPFLIGVNGEELMINIDLDHPRVSSTEGEPVFLPFGGSTEYLQGVEAVLSSIHNGLQSNLAFIAALRALELLEAFVVDIELDDGSQNRLAGFYTINEERLQGLAGADLERLQRAGHLHAIYMVLASVAQFRGLIDRKNRRHALAR
jgi:hypothetical protein